MSNFTIKTLSLKMHKIKFKFIRKLKPVLSALPVGALDDMPCLSCADPSSAIAQTAPSPPTEIEQNGFSVGMCIQLKP